MFLNKCISEMKKTLEKNWSHMGEGDEKELTFL
jgi:hypothetical protein